jgi:hypothetical protein
MDILDPLVRSSATMHLGDETYPCRRNCQCHYGSSCRSSTNANSLACKAACSTTDHPCPTFRGRILNHHRRCCSNLLPLQGGLGMGQNLGSLPCLAYRFP